MAQRESDCRKFDLSKIRDKHPLLVENLAHLPNREEYLNRIWTLEERWNSFIQDPKSSTETIKFSSSPEVSEEDFEIIYAGGTLGLLHATLMSIKYNRKVLVFDAFTVGKTHRDWNISDQELEELVKAGLFSKDEIEIVNRYESGFVKFYDENSKIKTPPLFMKDVLNVALDSNKLLKTALEKLKRTNSRIESYLRLKHVYVLKEKVIVECEEIKTGKKRFFGARLFIDATGTNSPISREINSGRSITHVCPTVGTVARGFQKGFGKKEVNFSIGEILVTTEDITDGRQLIWEGFPGDPKKDEYTTYLFFYDSVNSNVDKSLFRLFEEYFKKISDYKLKTANWKVIKPVFGYIPSFHHHGWGNLKKVSIDRILLIGDAAGLSSPLTFCGFGSYVRNFRRLTELVEECLKTNSLDEKSLSQINTYEPNVAQMASLAEFMRPTPKSKPSTVNETMNAVMMALSKLDPEIARELFQDRIKFSSFKKLVAKTAQIHPKVFKLMLEHLGIKGSFWWIENIFEAFWKEKTKKSNMLIDAPDR
jgi:lycopene cyclase CruA